METIKIQVSQDDVYNEVAKATDYTGAKLISKDEGARERILAGDEDLNELTRFWDESVSAANESLKEMLVSGATSKNQAGQVVYEAILEVSKAYDKVLTDSVQSTMRSYFISSIIAQWFKFANKEDAEEYYTQAGELMCAIERLLYSRKRPALPREE